MSIVAMKRALEALWDCTVKLESQQFRNPVQIPPVYSDIIKAGYLAHAALRAAIEAAERQEPVAWMFHEDPWGANEMHFSREQKDARYIPLYTTPQPAIPDGWQLVPVELNHDMIMAMEHFASSRPTYPDGWKDILAAAPEVPK